MSLKYVPPNAPSLISAIGVLFAPKSVYETPLSSNSELLKILTASFLLLSHEIQLKSASFTFNVAICFNS